MSYKNNCDRVNSWTINLWRGCEEVIPEFDENGNLPPGIHYCEWEEFNDRFGTTATRRRMIDGLELAITQLKADRDSYQSQVDELKSEIAEYERLIKCDKSQSISIKIDSLNKIPDALIKARIAAKISQEKLAEILGIEEERVKEYEDTDYQCASFVEILEVSTVLGVEFEMAVMRVDFEEIEAVKGSAEKWRKRKMIMTAKITS
ncbi:DNA-binding protein [Symplocastrum sp. BBK-W-15]|uniref:DNA-binding protein n=1 Tax=Limnofasciculus baicalensis BBK-W-15 TaxID=2699891 RepID=A0AAE3KR71_9CYAN|nr:DNA-binding protein [Limnofasciculus baicalensis]MCP2731368.1 DNA-binding protein [Limnofasciculus baicalensis BBK-W-15]